MTRITFSKICKSKYININERITYEMTHCEYFKKNIYAQKM